MTNPALPGDDAGHACISLRYVLPGVPSSAGKARALVGEALSGLSAEVRLVAELLVSEVVTNAVLYAKTRVELGIRMSRATVRISAADGSAVIPALKAPATGDAVSGRGLTLVDRLASAWGCERVGEGKRIWFELPV